MSLKQRIIAVENKAQGYQPGDSVQPIIRVPRKLTPEEWDKVARKTRREEDERQAKTAD